SRVTDILLFLADGQGKRSATGVEIPNLPHRELSSLSGLARETVTRVLNRLEKKDLIKRDRDTSSNGAISPNNSPLPRILSVTSLPSRLYVRILTQPSKMK
ncbi:MAG: helix-turn-helix domain-containing protein, partial [Cyanobacteria bacterium J06636_16]